MTIFHGWRCDECGECVNTRKPPERLPEGWNRLFIQQGPGTAYPYRASDFPWQYFPEVLHFCSRTCLLTAVTEIPARRVAKHEAEEAERRAIEEAKENVKRERETSRAQGSES